MNFQPDIEEIKKCLKDAGLYEENMQEDDMLNYYEVIKQSETTAREEINYRKSLSKQEEIAVKEDEIIVKAEEIASSSTEKPFKEKTWHRTKRKEGNIEDDVKSDDDSDSDMKNTSPTLSQKQNKSPLVKDNNNIDPFDCPPLQNTQLKIITHPPKFHPPIYCHPLILNLSTKKRSKIIYQYHMAYLKRYREFQPFDILQWAKPIYSSNQHESVDRCFTEDMEIASLSMLEASHEETEFYTSRSGRQTKRKIYAESMEDVDNDEPSTKVQVLDSVKKSRQRKRLSLLSNEEIMKRSKLFSVSPKTTRCEKIFDSLYEEEQRRKEQEMVMSKFTSSLMEDSDNENEKSQDNDATDIGDIVHKEETFIKRRIVPPVPGRRPINKATRNPNISSKFKNKQITPVSNESKYEKLDVSSPPSKYILQKKGKCPLCGDSFSENELVKHAAECNGSENQSLQCHVCDEIFALNTDYEVHVKECIAEKSKT